MSNFKKFILYHRPQCPYKISTKLITKNTLKEKHDLYCINETCAIPVSSASNSIKMAGVLKKTTNLTGMPVCSNPKYTLNRLYKRILGVLAKMPENAAYRKHTEEVIKHRSYIINSTDDVKTMEHQIGCGQIEEVVIQAKNELSLAQSLLVYRPWDNLMAQIPKNQWKWPVK